MLVGSAGNLTMLPVAVLIAIVWFIAVINLLKAMCSRYWEICRDCGFTQRHPSLSWRSEDKR
jgi:hypothetical protein